MFMSYSDEIRKLNRSIKKIVKNKNPTKRDLEKMQMLCGRQYYLFATMKKSIHYVEGNPKWLN
jgi:hypothetical protein